jgi:hypothetical protein
MTPVVADVTIRIRLHPVSAKYMLPRRSVATPVGVFNRVAPAWLVLGGIVSVGQPGFVSPVWLSLNPAALKMSGGLTLPDADGVVGVAGVAPAVPASSQPVVKRATDVAARAAGTRRGRRIG